MYNDYIPFTGGYVWSNPYEITRYERILSCTDGDAYKMEILCRDSKAYADLRHLIKALHCDDFIQVAPCPTPSPRARIYIKTRFQAITDEIKYFVDDANRQSSTKTSNEFVFKSGPADAFIRRLSIAIRQLLLG